MFKKCKNTSSNHLSSNHIKHHIFLIENVSILIKYRPCLLLLHRCVISNPYCVLKEIKMRVIISLFCKICYRCMTTSEEVIIVVISNIWIWDDEWGIIDDKKCLGWKFISACIQYFVSKCYLWLSWLVWKCRNQSCIEYLKNC